MKIIYISHPYGGLKINEDRVANIILELIEKYPDNLFLSPIHNFSFAYNKLNYDDGIRHCLNLLSLADEMWVFGDYHNSIGCNHEINYCRNNNIPFIIYE